MRCSQSSSRVGSSSSQTTMVAISSLGVSMPLLSRGTGAFLPPVPCGKCGNLEHGDRTAMGDEAPWRDRAADIQDLVAGSEEVDVEGEAHAEGVDRGAARDQQA